MLIHSFYPVVGGAERQLQALAPHLASRGIRARVITRRYPGLAPRSVVNGTEVTRLPIPGGRVLASLSFTCSALLAIARSRNTIDVLHSYDLRSPTTAGLLGKLLFRRPLVVKVLSGGENGDLFHLEHGFLGGLRRRLFARFVDRFVAVSSEIRSELIAAGAPPERIAFIPNGVDTQRFSPVSEHERRALRRRMGLSDSTRLVLFAGRLEPEKGLHDLLDAWPSVLEGVPDAALWIAGTGHLRSELEARRVTGVRFLGRVEDPVAYLRSTDCFVLPSRAEGLSNAVLEAMAVELPVVTTTVGGNVDLIRAGEEGILVPPRRPDCLAEALVGVLLAAPDVPRAPAARRRVMQDYALAATADRLAALYLSLSSDSRSVRS